MRNTGRIVTSIAVFIAGFITLCTAQAQTEYPPPGGKGRAIVAVSGAMGAMAYDPAARKLASFGYDVFLLDGNSLVGDQGVGIKAAIDKAQQSPNALPGKVGVVGFSLGGGQALGYGPRWPDQVAVVVAFYPLTSIFKDIPGTVSKIKIPVLMLAGEADNFKNCCSIDNARAFAAAAAASGAPLELVTYPGANHDFIVESNRNYDAKSAADAWARAQAMLKKNLSGS